MNTTRKLALKRERLTDLADEQLDGLAGGLADSAIAIKVSGLTSTCPSDAYDCISLDYQCVDTYRHVCGNVALTIAAVRA